MEKITLEMLQMFIKKLSNDDPDVMVLTGEEGKKYSEYSEGVFYISFEGPFYEMLNYCPDGGKVYNKLVDYLERHGMWFEFGNAWNISIYNL